MRILAMLSVIGLMCSCNSVPPKLNQAQWLEGSWRIKGTNKTEVWSKINDYSYSGMVFQGEGEEQKILEYLRFYKLDNRWNYSAIVPDQNRGREILFTESASAFNSFVVENAIHDFPKSIKYFLQDTSSIMVTLNEGEENVLQLFMTKD